MQKPNPRGCCGNPGICLACAQGQISLKGLSRATYCTDRAQTSGTVTPTVELCPPHPTFRTKVRARRNVPEGKKNDNYTYTYKAPLRGLGGVPLGVTQGGMPQGQNDQSPSRGSMWVIPCVRNIYLWTTVIPWLKNARFFVTKRDVHIISGVRQNLRFSRFHIEYHDPGEWGVPRGVTQAGIL